MSEQNSNQATAPFAPSGRQVDPQGTTAHSLFCPKHRTPLSFDGMIPERGVGLWEDGQLTCPNGCSFRVRGGVPRFTEDNHYSSAFGLQWRKYRKTQLDSYTGQPISRQRLEKILGFKVEELAGKSVLEVGAGAGRFTELLLPNCGELVVVDPSDAVEANLDNCAGLGDYLLLQADINQTPLPLGRFDVCVCLGVLQHTPDPQQTIRSLAAHLKPGGLLIIDHYRFQSFIHYITMLYPLRFILKRLSPEAGLRATRMITAVCDPIRRITCRVRWIDIIVSRFLPTSCYYKTYSQLNPDLVYIWNELDTHDALTDYYKHRKTVPEVEEMLRSSDLVDIECWSAIHNVEARAVKK